MSATALGTIVVLMLSASTNLRDSHAFVRKNTSTLVQMITESREEFAYIQVKRLLNNVADDF